ncbi:MAG: N-acetylmuramoyl-L-alanine amidase [Lachnospiraceae bacterium]|nr:N-acetylmuramoyl-L-alanine amidase [Lachnospiraceae bacterium]
MKKRFLTTILAACLLVGQNAYAVDLTDLLNLPGLTDTTTQETTDEVKQTVVVLDPGHDKSHKGAQYFEHAEEKDTLKIATYCKEKLETYPGVTVYMTREDEDCAFGVNTSGDCLKKRVEYTIDKDADLFVSFHLNAAPSNPDATGAEVYYSKKDGASSKCASLAGAILRHLSSDVGLKNRGIKRANYYVLNGTTEAKIPGVLIEHCFMTNEDDVDEYLSADSRLKKLGEADAEGIMDYINSTPAEESEDEGEEETKEEVDLSTLKVENLTVETDGFFVGLSWDDIDDVTAYQIYKYNEAEKKWKKLAQTEDTEYNDTSLVAGETGTYKVRAIKKGSDATVKSKFSSKGSAAAGNGQVQELTAAPGAFNRSVISWEEVTGAAGYKVSRQDFGSEKWKTIATTDNPDGYIDETTKCGKLYRYRVRAYRTADKKKVWGKTAKPTDFFQTASGKVEMKKSTLVKNGLQVNWTKKAKASAYIVYRKAGKEKKWTRIGKTKEAFFVDETAEWEHTYTYTVKAYRVKLGKKYMASEYDKTGTTSKAGTKVEGISDVSVEQMVAYYEKSGKTYPASTYSDRGAETLEDFCQIVYDVCDQYGVRSDLVWAQICKETGYLQFGGDVKADQCNFAGIGATGGGEAGSRFKDVEEGVTAQVQHLKLYATEDNSWEEDVTIVDPRYNEKIRGKAMLIEWLAIPSNPYGSGWAAAENYGVQLLTMMDDMKKM